LEERDLESLTRDEAVELLRRQKKELSAAKERNGIEGAKGDLHWPVGIKREAAEEDDHKGPSLAATPNKRARREQVMIELSD